jgi:hypothetical protein
MTVVWKSNRFHLKAENNLRGHCSFPTFFKDHSFFPIATNLSVSLSLCFALEKQSCDLWLYKCDWVPLWMLQKERKESTGGGSWPKLIMGIDEGSFVLR